MPSAWGGTRQNIFGRCAPAVNCYFAECLTQHSAKYFFIFLKNYFAECPSPGTRQSFFLFFLKITLPSAPAQALGKNFFYFFFKITLPSASTQALGKVFLFFLNNFFAECPCLGTRQRISGFKKNTLPSAPAQALGKVFLFF